MPTQTRTVETIFKASDSGYGAVVSKMTAGFAASAQKLNQLREKFSDWRRETGLSTLGALGLGVGIGSWVEKAREANAEFGRTQKGIAGILAGSLAFAKGTTEIDRYGRALVLSRGITEDLEKTAGRFDTNLDDVASTYRTVASAVGGMGVSQKQVMELTERATASAKAFGVGGEQAATAIARALATGSVRGFDPFDIRLRNVLGNMKKLTAAQRFDHVQRALQGSMQIADAMSGGIDANLHRVQMTVNGLIRDATGPLFKEIATSLEKWGKHIKEARASGQPLIEMFSGKLVTTFHTLERVSGFIKDHWKEMAAIWATSKTMGALGEGGSMASLGAAGGGIFGRLASGMGPVIAGLAAFKLGLDAAIGAVEAYAESRRAEHEGAGMLGGAFGTALATKRQLDSNKPLTDKQATAIDKLARRSMDEISKAGMLSRGPGGGQVANPVAIKEKLDLMAGEERAHLATQLGMAVGSSTQGLAYALADQIKGVVAAYANAPPGADKASDAGVKFAKQINNFNGGIHITQKFEDADPDRVFVRFRSDLEDHVERRTQPLTGHGQME